MYDEPENLEKIRKTKEKPMKNLTSSYLSTMIP